MKVGTLNFHRSQNYGALLVTYSLKTYLQSLGLDVRPVDYFPEHHTAMYPAPNKPYDCFIDKYLRPFGDAKEVYDLIVYGADTIWEHYKNYGYDDAYWGSDKLKAVRRITFSASGTLRNFSTESDELFKANLPRFAALSVREDVVREYIQPFTNQQIVHTCDPTFLLTAEDYELIMAERLIKEEYAVIYNRQLGTKLFEVAKVVSAQVGLPVFVLKGDGKLYDEQENIVNDSVGPSEFLSLIRYSSYVLAASFHAVAFSIIFRKQFNTLMKSGAERVESLLRKLELEDRRVFHSTEIDWNSRIDYTEVNRRIDTFVKASKKYLQESIYG